jgi:hypothetical protein
MYSTMPYRLVFFASLSILSFEIALIRIFSIRFSYHYASLIISISMIGLVLGGIFTYFKKGSEKIRIQRVEGSSDLKPFESLNPWPRPLVKTYGSTGQAAVWQGRPRILESYVFFLSISYPVIFIFSSIIPLDHYRMLWENIQLTYLFLFMASCSIPFFLYGIIISLSLSSYPKMVNRIYASDLSGAAGGVASTVFLLNYMNVEYIIIVSSLMLAVFLFFEQKRRPLNALYIIIPVLLCVPIAYGFLTLQISPYKGLMQALKDDNGRLIKTIYSSHSRLDVFENPRMKFAPGLSLVYTKPVPKGIGLSLDGEITGVMIDEKQIMSYEFFSFMPSALPYFLKETKDVLVVGFKGSLDALIPYYFGVRNIYMAEKDLSIQRFIHSAYGTDSVYRKSLYFSSGTKLVKNLHKNMDVIFISRTGFFPSGTFGLQEDYDVTVEALKSYISHLKEDGLLFIQMFLLPPPRYELRMMNNILYALNGLGVEDVENHLVVFRSWDTINFLLKRTGFTEKESEKALHFLASREFEIIYPAPDTAERFIAGLDYRNLFKTLLDKEKSNAFIKDYPFSIGITTNDKPFFHYFLKLGNLKEIYALSGKKWAYFLYEGMALPFILVFLIILSILIFIGTFLLSKKCIYYSKLPGLAQRSPGQDLRFSRAGRAGRTPNSELVSLCYFAFIGFSFMFIEVFFIHKFILPLESPVIAFSVVLSTILLSSGCGSLLSGYMKDKKIPYIMAIVLILLVFYFFLFEMILSLSFSWVFIIPLGILLGLFFPSGIKLFLREDKSLIPLAYSINGAASIIAPPLASIVAVIYGCRILLILSFILYGFSLLLLCFSSHRDKCNTA